MVCVNCTSSSVEWQLLAVGHAGCSQPANAAIQTAIPGLSAVGDGPQGQGGSAAHAIAAPGLASAARANLVATGSPVTFLTLEPASWHPLIRSRLGSAGVTTTQSDQSCVGACSSLHAAAPPRARPYYGELAVTRQGRAALQRMWACSLQSSFRGQCCRSVLAQQLCTAGSAIEKCSIGPKATTLTLCTAKVM